MRKPDFAWAAGLAAYAVFIWARDLRWLAASDDLWPILAGLPLFVWLSWPWRTRASPQPVSLGRVGLAAVLFAAGVLANSTLALAASWTLLLWSWCAARIDVSGTNSVARLMVLPLFSFPWIATDFDRLGWWFRLSGAAAVEHLLAWSDLPVSRSGTFLLVHGFQLSVEPACSGLNGLQSMIIAGTMLAFVMLKRSPWYGVALLALPLAAWTANVLRILSGAMVATTLDPAGAARWVGPLHAVAGWIALCAMFAVCWVWFNALARIAVPPRLALAAWARTAPWLETALLVYAGWRCHALLRAWFTAPFDYLGWIAFAAWILPIGLQARREGLPAAGSDRVRTGLLVTGVAAICLGDGIDLNALKYSGLALLLTGFGPRARRALWALAAIAWMPALGWVASRFGVSPALTGAARVAVAVAAAAWIAWPRARAHRAAEASLHYVNVVKSVS